MDIISNLLELDMVGFFMGLFIIISACVSILTIVSKFLNYIGKPMKWMKDRNKDHDLLVTTATALSTLQSQHNHDKQLLEDKLDESTAQSIKHDKEIKEDLEKLTKMFIDKEIDDQRWEILDFASALSSGRRYSKEQFAHVFTIFEKYEKILETHGLNNGQVTASMEVINAVYKEMLLKGF